MTTKPPLPPTRPDNETRLDALASLCILDTEPEAGYDDLTKYVAEVCDMPTALVSLVDRDRQWFKSAQGFDQPETGLESSVCAYVVFEDDFVEIEDLSTDPRTERNPLVTAPGGVRFYAGAPLRLSSGEVVGALCVLDTKPRKLNEFQRRTLSVMAGQVVNQMELRRALEQAEVLKKEVDHRVKNSLQSISSQIRIQARKARDMSVQTALRQVEARIAMAAALHEQLYRSADGADVDLAAFMTETARILDGTSPPHIHVESDFRPARVNAVQASAIGVIVNEFATNSIKHAFPEGRDGQVRFSCEAATDGSLVIEMKDNGIGMPKDTSAGGIGLAVIEASAAQLEGRWELQELGDAGTGARLIFPIAPVQ